MKKLLLSVAVIATMGLASCGASTDACSCKATEAEALKAASEAGTDADKAKAVTDKYAGDLAACATAKKDGGEEYAKALKECK